MARWVGIEVVLESTPPQCLAVSRDAYCLSRCLDAVGMLQHDHISATGWSSVLCPEDILRTGWGALAQKHEESGSRKKRVTDAGRLDHYRWAFDALRERVVLRSRSAPGRPLLPRARRAS